MSVPTPHSFHIPVMGLAYTIDSPIKVARFGVNSVISIIEDNLVEKMRSYYYPLNGEEYFPISGKVKDSRAKRVTDYLNLVNRIVNKQVEQLKKLPFEEGTEISKYFELLPDHSELKSDYELMINLEEGEKKQQLKNKLRKSIKAGNIDVNIMTKLDKVNTDKAGNVIEDGSDAVTALRGFANSDLEDSSIILSAGMNPRLFAYMGKIDAFKADRNGHFKKKIVIKVSDYRSAFIQGRMLAKKGLWVSEFRVESGLNCGGHAFASAGYLMGPILEEFKNKKEELLDTLFDIYNKALEEQGKETIAKRQKIKLTVQGGIGTNKENEFLHDYYGVDGTGWGTPFLLVPEATTVDDNTTSLLCNAGENDILLSKKSPLGIPFHYLKGTTADLEKIDRINRGRPGSPCPEKFLISNTEFSKEPICTASLTYQKKKLAELKSLDLSPEAYNQKCEEVLDKECLCIGLSNAAINKYDLTPFKNLEAVNVCPGPNIAYFSEIVSLRKMIDHIYGRANVLKTNRRPHMFIKELNLYIDYFIDLMKSDTAKTDRKEKKYIDRFYKTMLSGIEYYNQIVEHVSGDIESLKDHLDKELKSAEQKLMTVYSLYMCNDVLN